MPIDCTSYIRKQVGAAEILHGLPLNNEYELIPFNHFTFSRVYPIELGLGKRVVEKPIGYKRKDLLDALNRALESLNKNASNPTKYTLDDFTEGVYRTDPTTGTQYEMFFRIKEASNRSSSSSSVVAAPSAAASVHHDHSANTHYGVRKVLVMRPFAPMQTVQMEVYPKTKEKELIHIILPLSGRTSTFQSFMDKFVKIALKNDRRVHLTVVYFGEEGLLEARSIMSRVLGMKNSGGNSSNLKLLALNETFSRGRYFCCLGRVQWCDSFFLLFRCSMQQRVYVLERREFGIRATRTRTFYCLCAMSMWFLARNFWNDADGTLSLARR